MIVSWRGNDRLAAACPLYLSAWGCEKMGVERYRLCCKGTASPIEQQEITALGFPRFSLLFVHPIRSQAGGLCCRCPLVPLPGCSLKSQIPSSRLLAEPQPGSRKQTCTPRQGLAAPKPYPSRCHPPRPCIALPRNVCIGCILHTFSVCLPFSDMRVPGQLWPVCQRSGCTQHPLVVLPRVHDPKHLHAQQSQRGQALLCCPYNPSNSISWLEGPSQNCTSIQTRSGGRRSLASSYCFLTIRTSLEQVFRSTDLLGVMTCTVSCAQQMLVTCSVENFETKQNCNTKKTILHSCTSLWKMEILLCLKGFFSFKGNE